MQSMAGSFRAEEPAHPGLTTMKTTVYELIEAVSEEVQPGEDWLVAGTVLHLFETGKPRFLNPSFNAKNN